MAPILKSITHSKLQYNNLNTDSALEASKEKTSSHLHFVILRLQLLDTTFTARRKKHRIWILHFMS